MYFREATSSEEEQQIIVVFGENNFNATAIKRGNDEDPYRKLTNVL